MKNYNPKTARLVYLNNDGSRCVMVDANGNRERIPVSFKEKESWKDGQGKEHAHVSYHAVAVKYWQQCGNFAFPVVRRGKELISVYPNEETNHSHWVPFEVKYPQI